MKRLLLVLVVLTSPAILFSQVRTLQSGDSLQRTIHKGEVQAYQLLLKKGMYASLAFIQQGADIGIDLVDPSGKKIQTFDSPNGEEGPEPVTIISSESGKYILRVYPMIDPGLSDSLQKVLADLNQGLYAIRDVEVLSKEQYQRKRQQEQKEEAALQQWFNAQSYSLATVDAGNGFADLQPLKTILQPVQVLALGESSHGTSEFFRMKHRLLEYMVKEMGCTSFYIEASASRCRYINNYVLYGKGSLDTATAIQGFVTWRVEEVRNMIEWIRNYNASVSADKKVKFIGFDLQVNNLSWMHFKTFYQTVNTVAPVNIDSTAAIFDTASRWANRFSTQEAGSTLFKKLLPSTQVLIGDLISNEGKYRMIAGQELYEETLFLMRLLQQEIESYMNGYNNKRDYYMAENILYLLSREKAGARVVVWAHNMHIIKAPGAMGYYLDQVLGEKYYALGFEFYEGSFRSRNLDLNNESSSWDIITVEPPVSKSLPWYLQQTGKSLLFLDFRNESFLPSLLNVPMQMHSFGSMYARRIPQLYPVSVMDFDGFIFSKQSTAAKNFTRVIWDR